ncbi:putative disease resistance RPP8-like protein 2 isoform X2 [Carex rostrata]
MEAMKRMMKITKKLPAVRKLVHEIEQIQTRMNEIETSRVRYRINSLGEGNGEIKLPIRPLVLPDKDPDIVGFKKDQDHVVKLLLDETTKRRSVVSIWGAGGLAKRLSHKKYTIDQFVNKCGALPLALVVLGGLLSKKPCSYAAWNKVLQTMSWHADDRKKCSEIIGTSYEDLSFVLKSCFMYFAAFPEDHIISAKDLVQMWVAEGFIPQEDNRTLEETAENYLEDLVYNFFILLYTF